MRFLAIASVLFSAAVGVFASAVVERQVPNSVSTILTDLINNVTPLANQLLYATPQNATREALTSIIGDISTAVDGTVSNLNLLVGELPSVIMASVDGTNVLGASDIADLVATVVKLIFTAVDAVLSVVDSATTSKLVIYNLLAELGKVVLSLLSVVLSLVAGLLPHLLALLVPVLSIITSEGLTTLLSELLGGLL